MEVVEGVVEATTKKYGGGVKIGGKFYDISEGVELPEKGAEIVAEVEGKNIVSWKEKKPKQKHEEQKPEQRGREKKIQTLPVPKHIKEATDTFLTILEYLEEKMPDGDRRDRMIIASVVYKEVMEDRRKKANRP